MKIKILLIFLLLPLFNSIANKIFVPKDKENIKDAINIANIGDTIIVDSGTYFETLNISKSVVIIGNDSIRPILLEKDTSKIAMLDINDASDVIIKNIVTKGRGLSVTIKNCNSIKLANVDIESGTRSDYKTGAPGLFVSNSANVSLYRVKCIGGKGNDGYAVTGYATSGGDGGDAILLTNSKNVIVEQSELIAGDGGKGGIGTLFIGPDGKKGYSFNLSNNSNIRLFQSIYLDPFHIDSTSEILTSVLQNDNYQIIDYYLDQNYPNPFNPRTTIRFTIPQEGLVILEVYDLLGNRIKSLISELKMAGKYSVVWNAQDLSSGVYIYRLSTSNFVKSRKLLLLK
ncbi:MAG: T9SS type A sorting domain-containing protein [Bacteroidetes bacterium]|nr:T9SS type A sorting domain-containing protein [Bacteroidota bacterium]